MTVKMRRNHKRNKTGDICGFTPEEEAELVDKGYAVYYGQDDEPKAQTEESEAKSASELEVVEVEEDDKPDDPSNLKYPELKKAAYKKAAKLGDDLDDLLPDIRTTTLLAYLEDE